VSPQYSKSRFLSYLQSVVHSYPEMRLESTAAGFVLKP